MNQHLWIVLKKNSFSSEFSNSSFLVSDAKSFLSFLYLILSLALISRISVRLGTRSSLDSSENTSSESESDSDVDSDSSSIVAMSVMLAYSSLESDSDYDESESSQVA